MSLINCCSCPLYSDTIRLDAVAVHKVAEDAKKELLKRDPTVKIDTKNLLPTIPRPAQGPHMDIPNADQLPVSSPLLFVPLAYQLVTLITLSFFKNNYFSVAHKEHSIYRHYEHLSPVINTGAMPFFIFNPYFPINLNTNIKQPKMKLVEIYILNVFSRYFSVLYSIVFVPELIVPLHFNDSL